MSRPYVVTTRSLAARTDAGSLPVSPLAPWRWAPWWTVTVDRRREAAALRLPVVHDRERTDDEVWSRPVDEVGERRRRLAEAHVVGEAAAEAEAVEEPQPAEAATLVRPQLAGERGGLDLLTQRGVGQSAEQQPGPRRGDERRRRRCRGRRRRPVRARRQPRPPRRPVAAAPAGSPSPSRRAALELLDLAEVGVVAGAHLAQRGRVDADPAMADVQQRRPGLFGSGQLRRRDRRRTVVVCGGERPLHDRLAVEAGRPVARAATASPGRERPRWRARGARDRSARCPGAPAPPGPARGTRPPPRRRARRRRAGRPRRAGRARRRMPRRSRPARCTIDSSSGRCSGPVATSTASGLPAHTSAALHQRPGSDSSTSSRSTRHGSRRSSGTTRRSRRTSTGSPRARWARRRRISVTGPRASAWTARVVWTRWSCPVRARNTRRTTAVAAERFRGTTGSQPARCRRARAVLSTKRSKIVPTTCRRVTWSSAGTSGRQIGGIDSANESR